MRRALVASGLAFGFVLMLASAAADAAAVNVRIRRNPKLPAGADEEGRVLLYTPKPVQPGSTHSHFDISASPNLLMEPSISSDLEIFDVDLTPFALWDMGWPAGESNIRVNYPDSSGTGFKDPMLGDARKAALEAAVQAWASVLGSSVEIAVDAIFDNLTCGENGATLASAGPQFVFKNFQGSEPDVWYSGALAESLTGQNLSANDGAGGDLRIRFNSGIDDGCLGEGSRYYYGLDGDVPNGELSFVTVALHELGHGLGFVGLVDEATGAYFRGEGDPPGGLPDIFTLFTYDTKKKKYWDELSKSQRKKSAKRERRVVFDGPMTTVAADDLLDGRVVIEVKEPESLAGNYEAGIANFGPKVKKKGVSGDLVLVDDGSAEPTFACQPLINGAEVAGNIAVIDRGDCLFVDKVRNAQDAGATAVIIVHNESGFPPGLGGSDSAIKIPSVRVGKKDGKKIKKELAK